MNLPKYVYRDNVTDRVLAHEDELTEETLAAVIKENKVNFNIWKLHTLGKSTWYSLNDRCKSDTEMKDDKNDDWKCNCIKCQLKEML